MIYLDHNATSPLRPSARAAMLRALDGAANASSMHGAGRAARAMIEDARNAVARLAGARAGSVVFTSGGTEANVLALRGAVAGAVAEGNPVVRVFVQSISHDSVRANAAMLGAVECREIPVTADGVMDLSAFRALLAAGAERALVSVMAANNETGVVQPVAEIAAALRAKDDDALLHVDAVAAAGRIPIRFDELDADYLSLSAHKIGGPQGAGALVVREGAPLTPLFAGAQEMRRRGGTQNVAAIVGFGAAAEEAARDNQNIARLRDRFETELRTIAPGAIVFGEGAPRLGNTSNFAIPGLLAETALIALDLDGVAISSGAACSSGTVKPSHVLAAMGVPEALARCGLRLSLGWNSRDQDIDAALVSLQRLLARKARVAA